jgi:hypothetical protein
LGDRAGAAVKPGIVDRYWQRSATVVKSPKLTVIGDRAELTPPVKVIVIVEPAITALAVVPTYPRVRITSPPVAIV